jgi:hypothetical protein
MRASSNSCFPGRPKKESARRALKEMGVSAKRNTAHRASAPRLNDLNAGIWNELFVAHSKDDTTNAGGNRKLFTICSQVFQPC